MTFYQTKAWLRKRQEVLALDHYECQECKKRGRHTRAEIVHHVYHLDEYPEYALDIWVGPQRNLLSVCRDCHENVCHPERLRHLKKDEPITKERW